MSSLLGNKINKYYLEEYLNNVYDIDFTYQHEFILKPVIKENKENR